MSQEMDVLPGDGRDSFEHIQRLLVSLSLLDSLRELLLREEVKGDFMHSKDLFAPI